MSLNNHSKVLYYLLPFVITTETHQELSLHKVEAPALAEVSLGDDRGLKHSKPGYCILLEHRLSFCISSHVDDENELARQALLRAAFSTWPNELAGVLMKMSRENCRM